MLRWKLWSRGSKLQSAQNAQEQSKDWAIHFLIRKLLQGISLTGQIWKHWSGNCLIRKSDQIRKVSQEEAGGSLVVDGVWQFVLWEPYSSVQWGPTLSVLHRLPCWHHLSFFPVKSSRSFGWIRWHISWWQYYTIWKLWKDWKDWDVGQISGQVPWPQVGWPIWLSHFCQEQNMKNDHKQCSAVWECEPHESKREHRPDSLTATFSFFLDQT